MVDIQQIQAAGARCLHVRDSVPRSDLHLLHSISHIRTQAKGTREEERRIKVIHYLMIKAQNFIFSNDNNLLNLCDAPRILRFVKYNR